MRNPPAAFQTAIQSETVRIAEIYDFVLQSGEEFFFTTHTKAITWNSNEYTPLPLERSEVSYKLNLEADSIRISMGGIAGNFVSLLQANAVDNVEMTVRTVIWDDVTDPLMAMIEFQGTGDIEFDRREVKFNFKSILDNLNIVVPKNLFQEQCNNRLFDTQCTLVRSDYTFGGTASSDGGDKFTLIDTVRGATYQVPFDAGDEDNPIEIGDVLTVGGGGGNDFTGDAACKLLYRVESGALTTDTIGTNTLTNSGGVIADAVNFLEGAASGDFSNDTLTIADASLDSGVPLKSGEVNKDFTLCFRARSHNGFARGMVQKWGSSPQRSFRMNYKSTGIDFLQGHTGGTAFETASHVMALTTNQWYSIGITYQDSDKAWRIRVKDETGGTTSETTGNFANNISITTQEFNIGASTGLGFDGNIDEIVMFDDVKSASEIDEIIAQAYGGRSATCVNIIYPTAIAGTIWYTALDGSQFSDDDVLTGGGNTVTVNGTPAIDDEFYTLGEIEMTSGLNNGFRRMIVLQDEETSMIVNAFPNEIQSGDSYDIYPGCGQSSGACEDRFDNEVNYSGYLYVPKPEEAMT